MLILRYLKTNFMCRLKTKLVLLVLRFLKTYEAWFRVRFPAEIYLGN